MKDINLSTPRQVRAGKTVAYNPHVAAELDRLQREVLVVLRRQPRGMPFSAIAAALGRSPKAGQRNGWQRLMTAMGMLVADRQVARVMVKGDPIFRLPKPGEQLIVGPPVRIIQVPPFDPSVLEQAVLAALTCDRPASVAEIADAAKPVTIYAHPHNVRRVLAQLVREGRARAVPLGSFERYAAVPS